VHRNFDELRQDLARAAQEIEIGGTYSHYKDHESSYIVEDLGLIEATEEVAVIYFPESAPDIRFVRPLSSWGELVDGTQRFRLKNRGK
jgi:hypothetical protein